MRQGGQIQLSQQTYLSSKSYTDGRPISNIQFQYSPKYSRITIYACHNGHLKWQHYPLNRVILLYPFAKILQLMMNSTTFHIFWRVWPGLNYWGQFRYSTPFWIIWSSFWVRRISTRSDFSGLCIWGSVHMPDHSCLLPIAFHLFIGFEQLYRETAHHFQQTQVWEVHGYLSIHTSTIFSLGVNVGKKKTPSIQAHEVERNHEHLSLSRALVTNLCFLYMQNSSKVEVLSETYLRLPVSTTLSTLLQKNTNVTAVSRTTN